MKGIKHHNSLWDTRSGSRIVFGHSAHYLKKYLKIPRGLLQKKPLSFSFLLKLKLCCQEVGGAVSEGGTNTWLGAVLLSPPWERSSVRTLQFFFYERKLDKTTLCHSKRSEMSHLNYIEHSPRVLTNNLTAAALSPLRLKLFPAPLIQIGGKRRLTLPIMFHFPPV